MPLHRRNRENLTLVPFTPPDAEYVLLYEDIDRYFEREVLPHWPDARVNRQVTDSSDGLTGIVGTEINFNREFYVYTPPRSREAIQADIEAMEKRFMGTVARGRAMKPYATYKPSGVPWLGHILMHWQVEKLKFFTQFVGGGMPSKDNGEYWGGDIPWVPKGYEATAN